MMKGLLNKRDTVLVVIDFQEKLLPRIRFHEQIVNNTLKLIEYAEIAEIPIVVTEQYPKGLGPTSSLIANAIPGFDPIVKMSFGCFGEERFVSALKELGRRNLIVTGIETHVCVCQTVLCALDNYSVYVPADAVSSQNKSDWRTALERMRSRGADVVSTEMIIFEMMRMAGTDEFKKVLSLIK